MYSLLSHCMDDDACFRFLHRKGAAAGVFTLIGIAAGAVLLTFLVRFYRRRNRKRRERLHESFFSPGEKDLYGAAGATAAGVRPLGAGSGGSSGHDGAALTARSGGVRMDSDVTNHSSLNGDLSSNSAHHLLSVTPAVNSRRFSDPYVQQQQQQQAQTQAGGLLAPPNTNGVARWSLSEFDDYYNPNADTHAAEGIYLSGSGENGNLNQTGPTPHAVAPATSPFELYQPPISDPFNPPDAPSDPSPLLALPDAAADALRRTSPSPVHSTKDLVAMGFGRRRSKPPQEPQGYAPPPSAYIPRDTSRSSGAVSPSFAMTPMGSSSAGNHSQQQTRHQYPPPQPPPPARRRAGSGVTVESSAGGPRSSSSQTYSYSVYSGTERSSYSHSRTQSHGRRESHSHNGSIDTRARSSHSHSHSHSRSYDESEDDDVSVEDNDLAYSEIFGDAQAVDGEELDRHRDALEPALAPVRSAQDGGSIGRVSPEMMRAASGNKDVNGSTNGGHAHIWGLDRDDASSAVVSLSDAVDYSRRVVSSSALGPGVVNSRA
ncbi:hypothetical protein DL93DRAFT_2096452 [Clavulina sp. PMI_390]|nr:hypothetical protein DL93DRAFT_2096452 [Clavulina sp. PMI_390]